MNLATHPSSRYSGWRLAILAAIAFWISSSLILDLVIMPGLYVSGMMSQDGFASAGYSIFGAFNRIELVCASVVLTGILCLRYAQGIVMWESRRAMGLAIVLLAIALTYTYALTPEMSALGMRLNLFASTSEVPSAMFWMHQSYWMLELVKLAAAGMLLRSHYRLTLED